MVATPGALALLARAGEAPSVILTRHARADRGDLGAFDRRESGRVLKAGQRIFGSYGTPAGRVWIVTEWDCSSACVVRPEDY